MDAFGKITWWGFTPAQDLLDLSGCSKEHEETQVLNALIIGGGDGRHIIKTIAHLYKHGHTQFSFYVLENNLELYARQLLFLTIALEPQQRLGLQEKTELFLELFGNSFVREQTERYVEVMSNEFIRWITDLDYFAKTMPLFDMTNLKFKERDMLEAIFKFWRNSDKKIFDIALAWDLRLRQYLGVRYDSIPNVFDWDYSMKLCEKSASIINSKHYNRWRQKGIAFEIREGTYDTPNKTLASGAVFSKDGEKVARRGYWGDIIVSPYITFGIESDNTDLFQKANMIHVKTAEDVAEYNMLVLFHELANRSPYVPKEKKSTKTNDSIKLTEIKEELEEIENEGQKNDEAITNSLEIAYTPLPMENAKIAFLSLNSSQDLAKKSKFQNKFRIVYIANSMVHLLTKELTETFADRTIIIVETSKYLLELTANQHEEFNKKLTDIAVGIGCEVIEEASADNCFAKFKFSRLKS